MEPKINTTVLWDVENVTPKADSHFVDGLLSYVGKQGNMTSALAFGDWSNAIIKKLAYPLSEKGFELIHVPQPGRKDKHKRKKQNGADLSLITHATEMIFQYPHIYRYVLLTGDIDFRSLLQTLKKHGKEIIIICDSNNASENLLEFADHYFDYRNLLPDDEMPEPESKQKMAPVKYINKQDAFKLLAEAVKLMLKKNKIPTPGSVKVKMKLLNDNFDEKKLGYQQWKDFLNDAANAKKIVFAEDEDEIVLGLPATSSNDLSDEDIPHIINGLVNLLKKMPKKKWIDFSDVNIGLLKHKINIREYGYPKLKRLVLDAEKRGLVETKRQGLKWFVRLV